MLSNELQHHCHHDPNWLGDKATKMVDRQKLGSSIFWAFKHPQGEITSWPLLDLLLGSLELLHAQLHLLPSLASMNDLKHGAEMC